MKHGFYTVIYLIIFLVCFVRLTVEQSQYDQAVTEKIRVEKNLKKAVRDTAEEYVSSLYDTEDIKKQELAENFFEALYIYLGNNKAEEKISIMLHVPVILLIEEDGTAFLTLEEVEKEGSVQLQHKWSEKQKMTLWEMEERTEQIISQHSYIAEQYGLDYSFFLPDFMWKKAETPELPMILVVFQGWPLTAAGDIVYNNCIDAGVSIRETEYYIVEVPELIAQTYSYYHRKDCDRIGEKGRVLEEMFSKEKAMSRYGALPCKWCIK